LGSLVVAAVVLALASAGDPGDDHVELHWNAPAGCPVEEEVRGRLGALLGSAPAHEPIAASVDVERAANGDYSARLVVEMGAHRSERTLTASQCSALADATALVIAVTVDPASTLGEALEPDPIAAEPSAIPEPEAAIATPTEADAQGTSEPLAAAPHTASAPAKPGRSRRIVGVHVRALGNVDYGTLPGVSGAIGGAIGAHGRRFRFEVSGAWTFAREATVSSNPDASGRVALWAIAARGCGVPKWGRIELPLCGAVEAGALEGEGTGATVNATTARRPWVALTAGPALAFVPVPRVAILVGADLVVPLWRAQFLVGDELVHQPFYVGVRAGLGVELRFGVGP
jgi:hypothetical protein